MGAAAPQPVLATAASWGLGVLVGGCLVAGAQLLLALAGPGFGSVPLVLALAAIGAIALRLGGRGAARPCPSGEATADRTRLRSRVGWSLLGLVLLGASIRSVLVPESGWDAYSHWGLRAQAFAYAATVVDAHSEHEYYPPLVPLLEAWLYLHRGVVSIDLGKTVWAIVGSAFGVLLGWHLRLSLRAGWLAPYLAAGIVLATVGLVDGFWTGQADLPLTVYLTLATLAAWRWKQTGNRSWLVQMGVFAAAATLTKFEGLPRIGIVVLAVMVDAVWARLWASPPPKQPAELRPKLSSFVPAGITLLGASLVATALWTAFELAHAIAPNGEHVGGLQLGALGGVLASLLAVFGGVRTGGGLLVAALAWLAAGRRLLEPPLRMLTLVVLGEAVATLFAFLLSATSPQLEVLTSATRLVEQFLPLGLFVGVLGLGRVLDL